MKTITGITNKPNQACTLTLSDGTKATLNLYFRPQQTGWFLDVSYSTVTINGLRLVSSPNILRSWRRLIPFGLAFTMPDGSDPSGQEDFSTATFLLLEQADIATVEAAAFPGL